MWRILLFVFIKMLGTWIATFLLLFLVYKALKRKQMRLTRNNYKCLSFLEQKEENDIECIFSDDMSEFEKASAFISSGKVRLSDAAVVFISFYYF